MLSSFRHHLGVPLAIECFSLFRFGSVVETQQFPSQTDFCWVVFLISLLNSVRHAQSTFFLSLESLSHPGNGCRRKDAGMVVPPKHDGAINCHRHHLSVVKKSGQSPRDRTADDDHLDKSSLSAFCHRHNQLPDHRRVVSLGKYLDVGDQLTKSDPKVLSKR